MRAHPLVLLLLLAAPTALAQLPLPTACGPIALVGEPTPPAEPVGPGDPTEILLAVQNNGQVPATVTASASISQAGWAITAPEPVSIQPAAQATFRFLIEPTEEATEDATVALAASGACETPLGSSCPGDACNAGTVNAQAGVRLVRDEGFRLPGLDNLDFQPEYLIAGIVLVGLASAIPFAMRRKKGALHADCPEPLKMVKPGRGTSFPIELRNTGKEPTSATVEVGPVPEGWSAFMPLPEVQLAARESRSLWLMVRSPATAAVGDAVDVEVRLRDVRRGGSGQGTLVRVRAEVAAGGE